MIKINKLEGIRVVSLCEEWSSRQAEQPEQSYPAALRLVCLRSGRIVRDSVVWQGRPRLCVLTHGGGSQLCLTSFVVIGKILNKP